MKEFEKSIGHVISSIDKSTGGPARSVTFLIESVLKITDKFKVLLFAGKSEKPIISNFQNNNGELVFFEKKPVLQDVDILHGQGVWELPVHFMCKYARKRRIPYLISIRGMLEPWALSQGKLKKKLALLLYQNNDLKKATCLHATAQQELESIRSLGLKTPVAIIPNGIDIKDYPPAYPDNFDENKSILFLSRIHPKKGIENLIEAWSILPKEVKKGWVINIVGNGEKSYIEDLDFLIASKKMSNNIFIHPPVYGIDKVELYRKATLFVLPTYSENFGIVIAEALASFTPVITTTGTPWEDIELFECGNWIDIGVEPLVTSLNKFLVMDSDDFKRMGTNGRRLVEEKYSIDSVAENMIELYKWILDERDKPNFVDIL